MRPRKRPYGRLSLSAFVLLWMVDGPLADDCNHNGIADDLDIASSAGLDCDVEN